MKHKVGDTVRIQSREWMDAQERDKHGLIFQNRVDNMRPINIAMQKYAGALAKITHIHLWHYHLDIDNGGWGWEDWMFDPDFRPDGSLTPEDAIRAMLDGETLYDDDGRKYWWEKEDRGFRYSVPALIASLQVSDVRYLPNLFRCPEKRKRLMTRFEVLAWASSEESHGWVVTEVQTGSWYWYCPQSFEYDGENMKEYRRAKLLPDGSGIDESTIQGFEVEA